tara:strand:+ start:6191 stop:8416 length:2226 start_codon:yes stop_codon:yes gene_type:complete
MALKHALKSIVVIAFLIGMVALVMYLLKPTPPPPDASGNQPSACSGDTQVFIDGVCLDLSDLCPPPLNKEDYVLKVEQAKKSGNRPPAPCGDRAICQDNSYCVNFDQFCPPLRSKTDSGEICQNGHTCQDSSGNFTCKKVSECRDCMLGKCGIYRYGIDKDRIMGNPNTSCMKDHSTQYDGPYKVGDKDYFCLDNEKFDPSGNFCKRVGCDKLTPCEASGNTQCPFGGQCNVFQNFQNVGACSKNGFATGDCENKVNIGENTDSTKHACINKYGISLADPYAKTKNQCDNQLTADNTPCCKYGLCPSTNGIDNSNRCKRNLNDKCNDHWNTSKNAFCCDSDHKYKVGDTDLCCPEATVKGMCLNTTKYPVDPLWVGSLPDSCTKDADCNTIDAQNEIKKKGDLKDLDFGDSNDTLYSKFYCADKNPTTQKGSCHLGCGYLGAVADSMSKTTTTPPKTLVMNDTNTKTSKCKIKNELKITNIPILLDNLNPPAPLLVCNKSLTDTDTDTSKYWYGSKTDNATRSLSFEINLDPEFCSNAVNLLGEYSVDASANKTNNYTNDDSTEYDSSKNGIKKSTGATCTESFKCDMMSSKLDGNDIPWLQQDGKVNYDALAKTTNMKHKVARVLPNEVKNCLQFQPKDASANVCASAGNLPSGFSADQTTSPCYYEPRSKKCKNKRNMPSSNFYQIKGEGENYYFVDPLNLTVKCEQSGTSTNCSPIFLNTGEYCPNGVNETGSECEQP